MCNQWVKQDAEKLRLRRMRRVKKIKNILKDV